MKLKKGADPSIIFEIFKENPKLKNLNKSDREKEVRRKYSNYFSVTSKETIKANVREDIIVSQPSKRFLVKLPQDLKKLDIMAAHLDETLNVIKITFIQQKGNNASFNSTSESKTLECIAKCCIDESYTQFFELLPENLNPFLTKQKYNVDFCIGMVNACGSKSVIYNGVTISYLTNDDYLNYLGLEITTVKLAKLISEDQKVLQHHYDAVDQCCNWDYIYSKCEEEFYDSN